MENKLITLKKHTIDPYTKSMVETRKVAAGLLVLSQTFQRYAKYVYMVTSKSF